MRKFMVALLGAVVATVGHATSIDRGNPKAEAEALALAKASIALRSVAGPGNETPKVAELYRDALLAAGWPASDITIKPFADTAYLVARWRGHDQRLRPLVIEGHMDVVEARRSDWQRDPFQPIVEGGFLYGRGASDMKLAGALGIATLSALKRQGFTPRRDIVLAFSGDEESTMHTSARLAEMLAGSELMLNLDTGGGAADEKTGRPSF